MDRRRFLSTVPVLAFLPNALASAVTDLIAQGSPVAGKVDAKEEREALAKALSSAFEGARSRGKPLLVLIWEGDTYDQPESAPESKLGTWDAGLNLGDLFTYGGDEFWVTMALCEVHLTSRGVARAFAKECYPDAETSEDAWALLIEPTALGVDLGKPVRSLSSALAPRPVFDWLVGAEFDGPAAIESLEARVQGRVKECIAALVLPQDLLAWRAEVATQVLGKKLATEAREASKSRWLKSWNGVVKRYAQKQPVVPTAPGRKLREGELDWVALHAVDLGAAVVLAHSDPESQARSWLMAAARTRHWHHDWKGAAWGVSMGCGARPVHPSSVNSNPARKEGRWLSISCGMGFVPEGSRRFLKFYSAKSD